MCLSAKTLQLLDIVTIMLNSIIIMIKLNLGISSIYTVEPPYKGHIGTRHFVLYKEVQNVLSRYEVLHLGPL